MLNKTQESIVVKQLMETGKVSRNWCLRNYISRLGAIICNLNKDGWEIVGEYVKTEHGKDFVYTAVNSPFERVSYTTEDGTTVATKYIRK